MIPARLMWRRWRRRINDGARLYMPSGPRLLSTCCWNKIALFYINKRAMCWLISAITLSLTRFKPSRMRRSRLSCNPSTLIICDLMPDPSTPSCANVTSINHKEWIRINIKIEIFKANGWDQQTVNHAAAEGSCKIMTPSRSSWRRLMEWLEKVHG